MAREGIRHLAKLDLGPGGRGNPCAGAWPADAWAAAWRSRRHHRAQPACPLLGD